MILIIGNIHCLWNAGQRLDWEQQCRDGPCSPVSLTLSSPHLLRIPLHKGKSLRNTLKEHGLLEDFLRSHQSEFTEKGFSTGMVASEPLTNYLDVSVSAGLLRDGFSCS